MNLDKLWINFMKKGEFNPVHDHSGNISFVIYTSVPNEILMENKDFKGKGSGPGCISFFHGENSENYRSEYHFLPKRGYMFIFPAWLKHWVCPFQSDCVRISVSGNVHDSAPLNQIKKGALVKEKTEEEKYLDELKDKL